jgi:hypothetical protein
VVNRVHNHSRLTPILPPRSNPFVSLPERKKKKTQKPKRKEKKKQQQQDFFFPQTLSNQNRGGFIHESKKIPATMSPPNLSSSS